MHCINCKIQKTQLGINYKYYKIFYVVCNYCLFSKKLYKEKKLQNLNFSALKENTFTIKHFITNNLTHTLYLNNT